MSRRVIAGVALAVVGLLALLGVWGWLALPGLVASRTLGLLGVVCDPVAIDVAPDLSHASLAPTECTVPVGPIASFTLGRGAEIALTDLRPRTVEVPSLAVNPRALETAGTLAAVLLTGDTPDPLRRALREMASAAARTDVPERIAIDEIDFGRGDHVVVAHALEVRHGARTMDVTLASVGPPPYHGAALDFALAVSAISAHATPDEASIEGRFDVDATLLSFSVSRRIAFRLAGTRLDRADARDELWIEPSAELTWLRDHAQALLDEIAAAGGVREALHDRREARTDARHERIHALRERLDQRVEERRAADPAQGIDDAPP